MKNLIFILLLFSFSLHAKIVREGYFVFDNAKMHLKTFQKLPELTVDHINHQGYEVYGPKGLKEYLVSQNITFVKTLENSLEFFEDYPSFETIQAKLKSYAKNNPDIVKLFSIGKSSVGRDLWMVKLSDNVHKDELEPETKFIANMHGDEIVGRELMLHLIEDLIFQYRNNNNRIVDLINSTEIFIMPSMNPDGAHNRRRGNAKWIDLNRDFPDFTTRDNSNTTRNRAPETQALMKFQANRNFVLSANFHGGAVCVNYPWDTSPKKFPLHDYIVGISKDYANNIDEMANSSVFPGGITNGYDWYEVNGGMQDWSYHWHDDVQVTVEVSEMKWPPYSTVLPYYKEHRESLISYLESVHQGIGFVFPKNFVNGRLELYKINGDKRTLIRAQGIYNKEYYRSLPKGEYVIKIYNVDNTRSKHFRFGIFSRLKGVSKYINL